MAGAHDIFISYARADRDRVRVLADALARRGHTAWWDPEIPPGEPFDKVIARALGGAKAVIVVWSRHSVDSDWVLAEADEGKKRRILVPVLIERTDIPLGFRRTQAADLVGWTGDEAHPEWRKLADKIDRVLRGEMLDFGRDESGRDGPQTGTKRRRAAWIAAGLAAILAASGGAYYAKRIADDEHFAELLRRAETAIVEERFPDAERALAEARKLRPSDSDLIRAAARYSEELRRKNAERTVPIYDSATRDCAECPELVEIPAGTFVMGSPDGEKFRYDLEGPQRRVVIERPFLMGRFEVTVAQFRAFVRKSGHNPVAGCAVFKFGGRGWDPDRPDPYAKWEKPDFPIGEYHPVVCVSWFDAKAYAAWLSRETRKVYRLPSEAEWEYAARGGTSGRYYWGDDERDACSHANIADSTTRGRIPANWERLPCNDQHAFTAPVGRFKANAFGLHDMLGNAWEWVEDCLNRTYDGAPADGGPWVTGECEERIMRGAAWISQARDVRLANRGHNVAKVGYYATGFRVVREK